jgi:hypothetical protein
MASQEVCVFDCALGQLVSNYPDNYSDPTLIHLVRFWYTATNTVPKLQEFKALSSEPENRLCYGPIIVRHERKTAAQIAIAKFLTEQVQLPFLPPKVPLPTKESTTDLRQVFFLVWELDGSNADKNNNTEFLKFAQMFHRDDTELFLEDFILVGKRLKPDPSICIHNVSEGQLAGYASLEVMHQDIVQKHITDCLKMKVGSKKPKLLWFEERNKVPLERSKISFEQWSKHHPYFRLCTYDSKEGTIVLQPQEEKCLSDFLQTAYKKLQKNTLSDGDLKSVQEMALQELSTCRDRCQKFGWCVENFSHLEQWTPYEYLKALVRLPIPRSIHKQEAKFKPAAQKFALTLQRHIHYLTNVKDGKEETSQSNEKANNNESKSKAKKTTKAKKESKVSANGNAKYLLAIECNDATKPLHETPNMKAVLRAKVDGRVFAVIEGRNEIQDFLVWVCTNMQFPVHSLLPNGGVPIFKPELVQQLLQNKASTFAGASGFEIAHPEEKGADRSHKEKKQGQGQPSAMSS